MNWYKNIAIKTKLNILIIVVTVLAVFLGGFGIVGINNTRSMFDENINANEVLVSEVINNINSITRVRTRSIKAALLLNDPRVSEEEVTKEFEDAYSVAKNLLTEYIDKVKKFESDNGVDRQELIASCEATLERLEKYHSSFPQYIQLAKEGKIKEANDIMTTDGRALSEQISNLPKIAFSSMQTSLDKASARIKTFSVQMSVVVVIATLLLLIFVISISNTIRRPIDKIKEATEKVVDGNLNINIRSNNSDEFGVISNSISDMAQTFEYILNDINELSENLKTGNTSYRIQTNRYKGAFKQATDAINIATNELVQDALYVADNIKKIEEGKFDNDIKDLAGDKALSTNALRHIQDTLKAVSGEINALVDAASNGDLEYKIDSSKYSGEWKQTINGLNTFLENVVIPIKETQNALNQFAQGNFSHQITNEYKGEFNNIKQTVNYTANTINSYIEEISNILSEMANKNFDVEIEREYLGDFKAIQKSVNLIVTNLNILTKDIISSAEKVTNGSKQISESSISLAEGATEQAESVEKLNSVIQMIVSQIEENSKGSNEANELANKTRDEASEGSKQMDNMLLAMEEINQASSSISNIIKVIDDIAFQTNILALNAAVEAARAGEHGKGFAVVAEEVRNLAGRSQQAARETTELIETSVAKVTEGSVIANETASALLSIVSKIENISSLVEKCAISSNQQQESIKQITDAVAQISVVTQNNAATSEETAASSEELASQSEIFYESVADFKLKDYNEDNM